MLAKSGLTGFYFSQKLVPKSLDKGLCQGYTVTRYKFCTWSPQRRKDMNLSDAIQETGLAKQAHEDTILSCKKTREGEYLLKIWESGNLEHCLDWQELDQVLAYIASENIREYDFNDWKVGSPLHVVY